MYALDNDSGVKTMPEIKSKKFEPADTHWFTEGGNGVAPSYPGADWFNIVQAELLNILKEAKITPDKNKLNQITEAIRGVVDAKVAEKLEGKADKTHGHVVSDIQGLDDALDSASKKGLPVGAIVAFPKEFTNPNGFLKANGTTFSSSAFPDLYRTLGTNQLPNLNRSDVGMTAYFAVDNIPSGWIAFDDIATQVTSQRYPELYNHLIQKYGSISAVPKASDRFLRNAGNGLQVGKTQEDAIRNITGKLDGSHLGAGNQVLEGKMIATGAIGTEYANRAWSGESGGSGEQSVSLDFDASRVVPTAEENRPKSLVLKLCIKAINSFDGVQFWIKSHGSVINVGELDAGRLAQGLGQKADVVHTHNASQIVDFNNSVNQLISQFISREFTQSLAESGWYKFPGGLILQWGKFNKGWNNTSETQRLVTFPISFPRMALFVGLTEFTRDWSYTTTVQSRDRLTKTGFYVLSQRNDTMYFALGF